MGCAVGTVKFTVFIFNFILVVRISMKLFVLFRQMVKFIPDDVFYSMQASCVDGYLSSCFPKLRTVLILRILRILKLKVRVQFDNDIAMVE